MNAKLEHTIDETPIRKIVRWGLYPLSWMIILIAIDLINKQSFATQKIWIATVGILFVTYMLIEWKLPYQKRWAMSWRSFFSDLKFVATTSVVLNGTKAILALFTISMAGDLNGPASDWPIYLQVVAALLVFEALNYFFHRAMHETKGKFGTFLWRTHAVHHLPPRLYLVMHAVGHPINAIIIQILAIVVPVWFMGYSQSAVTIFLLINGMHGLISHFNVDVRMGWANYVFVGPELHRYHHSADVTESKNYGATLSIFDQMFGTFVYRPGITPDALGVDAKEGFPDYGRYWQVLKLPFSK